MYCIVDAYWNNDRNDILWLFIDIEKLLFLGNYVGDVNVDIMDKEIRLVGSKYVLNKIWD